MLNLKSSAYNIRNGGEGQYEFFADISTRSLLTVRVGEGAGKISVGSGNAFVGFEAGKENKQGSFGVFVGFQAGSLNNQANYCTYVGAYCGRENRRGNANTFVGFRAGELNKDGSECVAVGAFAMRENYSGNRSVAIGYRAAERTLNADYNTIIGAEAGQDNRSGNFNTMAGYRVGRALFRGNENTYFGAYAGYSNVLGDGNCFVGFRAGYELSGNNNVYVGLNVGCNLSGNENVILGARTLLKYNTNGTVAIGYNIGNNFERGNCNVFVGYNVDTHDPTNSYGIAIGTRNVKTYHNAISIGQNLDSSGLASVLIGRDIISDSDNSISIGNDIDISSVYVLSDRLDWRFPINQSKTYELYDLQESYSDTIFNGITSNTSAIFAKNTSNIYNSGDNRKLGRISSLDSNLINLYYSHILYQGLTNFYGRNDYVNIVDFFQYINDPENIQKRNMDLTVFTTGVTSLDVNQMYTHNFDIPIVFPNELYNIDPALYSDKLGVMGLNLIRMDDLTPKNEFTYTIYFPKNRPTYILSNYKHHSNNDIDSVYQKIKNSQTIIWNDYLTWTYEFTSNYDIYKTSTDDYIFKSNVILNPPKYGKINTNLYGQYFSFDYQLYPESLFASNDVFTMATGRELNNIVSISQPKPFYINMCNVEYFNSNTVNLHPTQSYYLDRALVIRKPLYASNTPLELYLGTNMTMKNKNATYTSINNPIQFTYNDIIQQQVTILPTDSNVNVDDKIYLNIDNVNYTFNLLHYNSSNYILDYPTSNIDIYLPTSNVLRSVSLPDINATEIYIRKQPAYGNFTIPETITNTNTITYRSYHPYKEDNAELLIKYQQGGKPYYKLLNLSFVRNTIDAYLINSYKLHETPFQIAGLPSENSYILLNSNIQIRQLTSVYTENYTASVSGGSLPNKVSYSKQYTCNIPYYNCNIGYVYQSNITLYDSYEYVSYNNLNTSDRNKLPARIPWNGITCNIYYYQYTGELPNVIPNNGSYNLQTLSSNSVTYSTYYFYGQSAPYYQYDILNTGSENIYWRYIKQVRYNDFYKQACNITILSCNENYNYQNYISIEDNNYLFRSNVPILTQFPQTSNYILLPSLSNTQYNVTTSNYRFIYQTSNYIPTIKLKQHNIYQKNGTYHVNRINPYDNFIHKGIGKVSIWHQSNIETGSIYYWLSSNLPNSKVYELHKIYFMDGKVWNINYYNNYNLSTSLDQTFSFYTSNFISQELDGLQSSPNYNFRYQNDQYIGIQSFSNSIIINKHTNEITNSLDYSDTIQKYYYVPLSKNHQEHVETFYIQTTTPINKARTLLRKPVAVDQRIIKSLDINQSISDKINYLSSNHLYTYYHDLLPNNIKYKIVSHSNDINKTSFTQEDINQNKIYLNTSNTSGSYEMDYVLLNSSTNIPFSTGTLQINQYKNTIYPSTELSRNSCNVLIHLQNTYKNRLEGFIWNIFEQQFSSNQYINSNALNIHILKNPSKGYLYSSNLAVQLGCNVITKINYHQFKTHKLHYIPYNPLELSNDTYSIYFDYKGDISPVYDLKIKNYWSRFSPLLIDDTRVINDNYQITTNRIPLSQGLQQDGYQWEYNGGLLSIAGYNVDYVTEYKKFTERPYFKINTLSNIVDSGDYLNFKDLILPSVIVSSNSRDLHYFITNNPTKGCVLKYNSSKDTYLADTYFTYTDVIDNKVFYHHYGEQLGDDKIEVMVGSLKATGGGDYNDDSVMDLNSNALTYNLQIQEKPKILKLNEEYIYKQTSNAIANDYNLVSASVLSINRGNINVFSKNNIDFYVDNGSTCNYSLSFSSINIVNNKVYYRINSNIFVNNSNINNPMVLNFIISSQSKIETEVNPLSLLPYYSGLYLYEWNVKLNSYESSNVILKQLNNNQVVQYYQRRISSDFISFDNRRLQIDFTLYPEQQVLYDTTQSTSFQHINYLNQLKTFSFDFKILDNTNTNLVFANFTHSNIRIVNSNSQHVVNIPASIPFNTSTLVSFVLNDERNNNNLSMYINNINYLSSVAFRPEIPPSSSIRSFVLQANINDPLNYYNYILTSNISKDVYLYYNLTNFTNRLKFNDFNILVNTNDITFRESYTNDTYTFSSNLHNVIIGKILDVKGLNNICIGKNFKTIGSDSIILGNNIGVNINNTGGNTLNEIFQSIVIANNSFINSKVRDVIAIGNNIFGTDASDSIDFNGFLQKKPVLVGNDISVDLIDFHINFQNTVLKTTYNNYTPGGIYLGLNKEIVAIGYETNQSFSNEYQLYVNGGISYKGNITSLGDLNNIKQVFGNIAYTSGTYHEFRIRIQWENVQLDDYAAFTVSGKFRGILTDSIHIYRRFETWVTPKNDVFTSKPKSLTDFEIASYSSVGIDNYEHDIIRESSTSVIVHIEWETLLELTSIEKMIVHLDLEVSYPNALGKVLLTKI